MKVKVKKGKIGIDMFPSILVYSLEFELHEKIFLRKM